MRQTVTVFGLTLVFLAILDGLVGVTLGWAERGNRLGSLVQYFEYGRSVPGKLERWENNPGLPENLYDIAWRDKTMAQSAELFAAEASTEGPVVRTYGMSFVNHILKESVMLDRSILWDHHSGPGAPPNSTFAMFEDDRSNRKRGDIAILGLLSSSVVGMAALSNQTWSFEQPAPFTYPIYQPEAEGLERVTPLITSSSEHRALRQDTELQQAWYAQLRKHDQFWGAQSYGATFLDVSPFARLSRRSLAIAHVEQTKQSILDGGYPYDEVLRRMVVQFAQEARAEELVPIVFVVQGRQANDPDLLAILETPLAEHDILYLATAEHFNPRDPSGFASDGHFLPKIDRLFATEFLKLLADLEER